MFNSPSQVEQTLRRLQLELEESVADADPIKIARIEQQIAIINDQIATQPSSPVAVRQGILNMVRNSDHNHSVNTWWETAPSATDKDKEAANVYAYAQIAPITITDAVMSSTVNPNNLTSASNPFTAGMTGRYAIVTGAGAAGADLSGVITYVSAGLVTLSNPCLTTVAGVEARINLQKLGHTNKKNSAGSNPNDALKDASHSQIATNIADPDWVKTSGNVRLGSTNVVGYSFGKFDNTGATYAALHQLFAGRQPYARLNIARANQYVKITGRLFLAIYNNHELVLDWIRGSAFDLSEVIEPVPASTVSTQYIVVIETDQGFTLVSEILTVAGAPDDTAMAHGSRLSLGWSRYAGATVTTVYRKRSGGNVFKMEAFESGANTWTDVNLSTRVDTGTGAFPTFANSADRVAAYWASAPGELDSVSVDGAPGEFWMPIEVTLPFPPTVNMGQVFDPFFIVGLTEALATEVTDVVTNGTTAVTSAAAQFTAAMTGKAFTLTKSDGTATVSGTFTYVSATSGTLSTAATWSEAGSTLLIADSQPNGLYYDLVGVSLNKGEWDPHTEDGSELRGQSVASTPNGSTQGSTTGGEPTGGGDGGLFCVLDSMMVSVRGKERRGVFYRFVKWLWRLFGRDLHRYRIKRKPAIDVVLTDRVWNGLGHKLEDFNEIEAICLSYVGEIRWLLTERKRLGCTAAHRVCSTPETYKCGTAVAALRRDNKVLISDEKSRMLDSVLSIAREGGHFRVISFKLKRTGRRTQHLIVINDIVCHNEKIIN